MSASAPPHLMRSRNFWFAWYENENDGKDDAAADRGGTNTQTWIAAVYEISNSQANHLVPDVCQSK